MTGGDHRKQPPNHERFPYRADTDGHFLCRVCGCRLPGRKTSFCGPRCLARFFLATNWRQLRKFIFARDCGLCMICGGYVRKGSWHVDHIVPVAKGGDYWDPDNLQLACASCNLKKGAKEEP